MINRIFMTIQRGLTDKTPVCVYPWEKPILEEIHGGNAVEVSIVEMCDLKGATKIKKLKLLHKTSEEGPTMREQYEAMTKADPESDPLADPEAEYGRLAERYGMHTKVALPNVEKVYGSIGNFRRAMRDYARGKTPDFLDTSGPIKEDEQKPVSEMSDGELKAALTKSSIDFGKKPTREHLENLYTDQVAA